MLPGTPNLPDGEISMQLLSDPTHTSVLSSTHLIGTEAGELEGVQRIITIIGALEGSRGMKPIKATKCVYHGTLVIKGG